MTHGQLVQLVSGPLGFFRNAEIHQLFGVVFWCETLRNQRHGSRMQTSRTPGMPPKICQIFHGVYVLLCQEMVLELMFPHDSFVQKKQQSL